MFSQIRKFVYAVCALPAVLSLPAHAGTWPTTEFIFDNSNPSSNTPGSIREVIGFSSDQVEVLVKYENYLNSVALVYQSMGFKAPPLPIVKGRSGGDAYRVHMYDYNDNDSLARAAPRPDGSAVLMADLSRAIVNDKTVRRMFDDLAHELFHTVQYAYLSYEQSHESRSWIYEGQAQAVGMEMALNLKGVDIHRKVNEAYRLGGRPYHQPIDQADPRKDQDYATASFWRYVGEYYTAAKSNGRPDVKPVPPGHTDYRYLTTVLSTPLGSEPPGAGDLRWLDAGLKKATGLGLQRMYAGFVSSFAAYVPERTTPSGTPEQAQETWLRFVYGGCPQIDLSDRVPSNEAPMKLRKNAAGCFKVNVAGSGATDVSLQTRAESVAALEALQIGTSGGEKIGSAQIVPSPSGGGYIGHWRFRFESGFPQVFVVSNMAADPATSLDQDLTINATFSKWFSDLTPRSAPPASAPGSRSKPAAAAAGRKPVPGDATRTAARDELASGLQTLSSQTALGAAASFERERPRCQEPFGLITCGPLTTIRLSLAPGGIGDMTQTTGTGGGLAQFMAQMSAIADHGVMQTDSEWRAAMETVRDTEGSTVTITIPLIDYGFTGSFENAAMTVNGGARHGNFRALGPQDSLPGRGREYRQSGTVTIEEFTPYVLRGQFHASLTDMSAVEFSDTNMDMTLPVDRRISGSFVVAAPWEGDRAVTDYQVQSVDAGMQDLVQAFPAMGNLDLAGLIPPDLGGDGSGDALGVGLPSIPMTDFPRCACDCGPVSSRPPECRPICKPKVKACWAETSRQEALKAKPDAAETATNIRQTREEYIEELRRGGLSQEHIDRLMPGIDAFWEENGGWPK